MRISAVIFDLDGTLIDSEDQWSKAFVKVLKLLGKDVHEKSPQIQGLSNKSNWNILLNKYKIKTTKTLDELEALTLNEYSKLTHEIALRDGALEFVESLRESGIKVALATSTDWWIVEKIFDRFGMENLFDSVTTGEEVLNKKPAPDSFLTASDKLGIMPDECVVVEDTAAGIEAAKAAQTKVIAVDHDGGNKSLTGADLIVNEFSEVTPQVLAKL